MRSGNGSSDDEAARAAVVKRIRSATRQWSAGADLSEIRAGFERLLAGEEDPICDPIELDGVPAVVVRVEAVPADPGIVYFHGGGFQVGSIRSHLDLMARLSRASGRAVVGVDYRLAPEHRFPAAHEDCLAAWRAFLGGRPGGPYAIAGDSAGGHLALSVALATRGETTAPGRIALISPWLDLAMTGESYSSRADYDVFSRPAALAAMARTYVGRGGGLGDPRLSILDGNLAGLPPLLVHAGDHDITLDDAVRLDATVRDGGGDCRLTVWPGMMHHFQVFADLAEARRSIDEIGAFLGGGAVFG